jgi:hypothetical protein
MANIAAIFGLLDNSDAKVSFKWRRTWNTDGEKS